MDNMIKELWYGNIIPQEDGIFNKPQFKELLGYNARNREKGNSNPLIPCKIKKGHR